MLIKQISVFVENVPGKLVEVSQILGDNGIDMSALSLADSSDFGILRLIVNDPDKAYQVLRDHAFVVKQSDVIAAVIDRPSRRPHCGAENPRRGQSVGGIHVRLCGEPSGRPCRGGDAHRQRGNRPAGLGHPPHFHPIPPRYLPFITPLPLRWRPPAASPWLRAGFSLCLTGAAVSSIISLDDIKRRYFREEANPCPKNQWSP